MVPTDFPASLPDFQARFGTDDACRDYLFARRWPDGFCCSECGVRRKIIPIHIKKLYPLYNSLLLFKVGPGM